MKLNYLASGIMLAVSIIGGVSTSAFAAPPSLNQCNVQNNRAKDSNPKGPLKTEILLSEIPIDQNDLSPPNQDSIMLPTQDKERKQFYIGLQLTNFDATPYVLRRYGASHSPQILSNGPVVIACGQSINFMRTAFLEKRGGTVYMTLEGFGVSVGGAVTTLDNNSSTHIFADGFDDLNEVLIKTKIPPIKGSDYVKPDIRAKFERGIYLVQPGDNRSLIKLDVWCASLKSKIEDKYGNCQLLENN